MKKIFFMFVAMLILATTAFGATKTDTCNYIKGGAILDKFGDPIKLGYNKWGYNYEAHMFNGMYCDAYGDALWCQQFKDVRLQMKWNDAWLSNKDCGTQDQILQAEFSSMTPDNKLDRHYPTDSYIGSGAWLTNHALGTYTSTQKFNWDVTGQWVLTAVDVYSHGCDLVMQQVGGAVTGTCTYPAGGEPVVYELVTGTVTGDTLTLNGAYYSDAAHTVPTGYSFTATLAIAADGTLDGTFTDSNGYSGKYESTSGAAVKVFQTCTVSDFVKIIAVPSTAVKDSLVSGYYGEGMWYTDNTKSQEIGPALWGSFAVIQEIASDPCGEYGVIDYFSPLRKGLGNW